MVLSLIDRQQATGVLSAYGYSPLIRPLGRHDA